MAKRQLACGLAGRAGRWWAGTSRGFVSACGHAPFFSRPALGVRHGQGSAYRRLGVAITEPTFGGASGSVSPGRGPSAGSGLVCDSGSCTCPSALAEAPRGARSTEGARHTQPSRFARLGGQVVGLGAVPSLVLRQSARSRSGARPEKDGGDPTLRARGPPPRGLGFHRTEGRAGRAACSTAPGWLARFWRKALAPGLDPHLDRGPGLRVRCVPLHPGWLARF